MIIFKKHLAAAAILALTSVQVHGDTLNAVTVTPQNGDAVTIALSEKPAVTFTDNAVVLKGSATSVEFPIDQKATFTFTNIGSTGISKPQTVNNITFVIGQELEIMGLAAGETVYVYDIKGQAVARAKASSNGQASINLGNKKGTLIVRTSDKSIKINF